MLLRCARSINNIEFYVKDAINLIVVIQRIFNPKTDRRTTRPRKKGTQNDEINLSNINVLFVDRQKIIQINIKSFVVRNTNIEQTSTTKKWQRKDFHRNENEKKNSGKSCDSFCRQSKKMKLEAHRIDEMKEES